MILISLLALVFFPNAARAGVLELTPGSKKLEGVSLSEKAVFQTGKDNFQLISAGSGLRFKKVVFVKAKVYVGQLFLTDPAKFQRTEEGALASLENSNAVAMHLTFLRDVDAKALNSAFSDAFKENGISIDDSSIKNFLEAVKAGGGAKENKTLVIVGHKKGNSEYATYEDSEGKKTTIEGDSGFLQKIFTLWLGKPSDSGVESLKREILGLSN